MPAGAYPQAVDEVKIDAAEEGQNATKGFVMAYDPAAQVEDIFAGLGADVSVVKNGVDLNGGGAMGANDNGVSLTLVNGSISVEDDDALKALESQLDDSAEAGSVNLCEQNDADAGDEHALPGVANQPLTLGVEQLDEAQRRSRLRRPRSPARPRSDPRWTSLQPRGRLLAGTFQSVPDLLRITLTAANGLPGSGEIAGKS
jgi:hypothetical protein